jgi:hypothetical protein
MWGGNMMGWSGGVGNFGFMPILFCGVLISAVVVLVPASSWAQNTCFKS